DPFGSYADDALVSLGEVYLLLNDTEKAKESFERLLNEFPKSPLVSRARLGITKAKVIEGKADTQEVRSVIRQVRSENEEKGENVNQEDMNEVEESLSQLEEMEAKKMWDASMFYWNRGSPESRKAAVFSWQELSQRFPKTSYAKQARDRLAEVGENIPEPKSSRFIPSMPKLNLKLPNPFRDEKEEPKFVTPQIDNQGAVKSEIILEPIPGVNTPNSGGFAATVNPENADAPRPGFDKPDPVTGGGLVPPTIPGQGVDNSKGVSEDDFGVIEDEVKKAPSVSGAFPASSGEGDIPLLGDDDGKRLKPGKTSTRGWTLNLDESSKSTDGGLADKQDDNAIGSGFSMNDDSAAMAVPAAARKKKNVRTAREDLRVDPVPDDFEKKNKSNNISSDNGWDIADELK
ncbi:MAG: tetratricopeptide repeat protein, partial [Planctomycetes bacterium]|nr:tetratricopeptide repeat protein [Planctomycetota bacterium]